MLVTPNAVMFDPDVLDPLVKEYGIDKYGLIIRFDEKISRSISFVFSLAWIFWVELRCMKILPCMNIKQQHGKKENIFNNPKHFFFH